MNVLNYFFNPKSVAVIGASSDSFKAGGQCLMSLLQCGYKGTIYPINPHHEEIFGVKTYPSVTELPEAFDIGLIVVPSQAVKEAVLDCARAGAKGVIIISSGFKEAETGQELEKEILQSAIETGVKIIGPNTLGLINTACSLNLSFVPLLKEVPRGPIGLISQSGGVCMLVLYALLNENIGTSKAVALGNRCNVEFSDILAYFGSDPEIKVVLIYLEGIENPRLLLEEAKKITMFKPVVAYKVRGSEAVNRAAFSHTGTMTGSFNLYQAAFRDAGIVSVTSIDELIDTAKILSLSSIPRGNRVGIATVQAGLGIIFASVAEQEGLKLAELAHSTIEALDNCLSSMARYTLHSNPIDITFGVSDKQIIIQTLRLIMQDNNVDMVALLNSHHSEYTTNVLESVEQLAAAGEITKPFVLMQDSPAEALDSKLKDIESKNIPVYRLPDRMARALANLYRYADIRQKKGTVISEQSSQAALDEAKSILAGVEQEGLNVLTEPEAKEFLSAAGIPVTPVKIIERSDEACRAAASLGTPVVLKLVSPLIVHKSDIGGVKLNLAGEKEIREAYEEIILKGRYFDPRVRVSVQPMAPPGIEVIVGAITDSQFGPVIMFGLGGTTVEVYHDVSFRLLPLNTLAAREMIQEIKGFSLLQGYRGRVAVSLEPIVDILMKISTLVTTFTQIKEIDMNPVIVYPNKALVVDSRILLTGHSKLKYVTRLSRPPCC
ncbi:MAG TPA: hypothetical protein DCK76_02460 [Desulfotomaculum sp.]|nr:hypothetical protein [Desulfotomaculum sp.]